MRRWKHFTKVPTRAVPTSRRRLKGLSVLACAGLLFVVAVLSLRAQNPASVPPMRNPGASPAATAQAPPTSTDTTGSAKHRIRVRVELVNIPVTVLDKRGLPIIDLTRDDFRVYEDGKLQTIRYCRREPPLPLWIGLILDTSNTARRQLPFEKDAASEFVYNILQGRNTRNTIYLQTFDATSSVVQDFTSDPDLLNEKIRDLKAGGGKALFDAIYFASREKMLHAGEPENVRRVLVVITDGLDVQSRHSLDEAISMAHRAETAIYAIANSAYGFDNPGDKTLQELGQETGGTAYFPLKKTPGADFSTGFLSHGQIGDTSQNKGLGADTGVYSAQRLIQMADSLELINRELDGQYSIGYTPANDALDGTFRSIRVVALRKGVQVRSKVGYFASPAEE